MDDSTWITAFRRWWGQSQASAVAVCFPEYRPDLVSVMANQLACRLYDFRKEQMAPLGWKATSLPLSSIADSAKLALADHKPVVLQNIESLLAVHDSAARKACLAELLAMTWPQRLILPLVLYASDAPHDPDAIYSFSPAVIPEQSLLLRLTELQ